MPSEMQWLPLAIFGMTQPGIEPTTYSQVDICFRSKGVGCPREGWLW